VIAPDPFVVADAASALLMGMVVLVFARLWFVTRSSLALLLAAGFALLGMGMATVSASVFDLGGATTRWDALRLVLQLSASLVLLLAYVSAHFHRTARPGFVAAWTIAGVGIVAATLLLVVPPAFTWPDLATTMLVSHWVELVAYLGCAYLAGQGYLQRPAMERALVPAAFLAYAASKYTWLMVDTTSDLRLIPFVYAWRVACVGLLLVAVGWTPGLLRDRVAGPPAFPADEHEA
jgi:hypothetical protein